MVPRGYRGIINQAASMEFWNKINFNNIFKHVKILHCCGDLGLFSKQGFVWNSAEKAIFRVGSDVLSLSTKIKTLPLGNYSYFIWLV